jgi:hypothetical protein
MKMMTTLQKKVSYSFIKSFGGYDPVILNQYYRRKKFFCFRFVILIHEVGTTGTIV